MEDNNEMDGYMEFFYQFSKDAPAISVRLSPGSDLSEVLTSFEGFLRAAGYVFTGEVDIIREQTPQYDESERN